MKRKRAVTIGLAAILEACSSHPAGTPAPTASTVLWMRELSKVVARVMHRRRPTYLDKSI